MIQEIHPQLKARKPFLALLCLGIAFLMGFWLIGTQPVLSKIPLNQALSQVDSISLKENVKKLSQDFFPRDSAHPDNLARAARFLLQEFRSFGVDAQLQSFSVWDKTYYNVIGHIGPMGGSRIVVGAHYDSYGELPAADDNASGVAGLLELIRLFSNQTPSIGIDFVAFSLEEPPHFGSERMGSAMHARLLSQQGVRVKAMISLEMIGYFSLEKSSQTFPVPLLGFFYPRQGDFIAVVGQLNHLGLAKEIKRSMLAGSKLPVFSINAPESFPGIAYSDHLSYWREGFPAVMITDTASYRNKGYHTKRDTWDRLDYLRMSQVVQGVYSAVEALADSGSPDI